ncbi:MAG TPA: FMN-binding negative transcriptional regulator [Fimbriimonadaceae bacterium]|jgi:transcriptional regulator
MYTPPHFRAEPQDAIEQVILDNPFAILITQGEELKITHLPVLYDPNKGEKGTALAHMARANDHWQPFEQAKESVLIFNGPHAYVSSSWYTQNRAVPTWNYAAVHLYGNPQILDEEQAKLALRKLIESLEPPDGGYEFENLQAAADRQVGGIVAFEMPVTRIEAKFKMSQNKTTIDRDIVIDKLSQSERESDREVAEFMKGLLRAQQDQAQQ